MRRLHRLLGGRYPRASNTGVNSAGRTLELRFAPFDLFASQPQQEMFGRSLG
jgi:hypothetical protein